MVQTPRCGGIGRAWCAQFSAGRVSEPEKGWHELTPGGVMRRDSERADREGAGGRWRGVPAADRATSPGTAHALLPTARLVPDAEDALQDTLLAAWRALHRFEGRASIRTWLYPDRHEPVPQRDSLGQPSPGKGAGCARDRTA